MKKILSITIIITLSIFILVGCSSNKKDNETITTNEVTTEDTTTETQVSTEKVNINIAALKGPTAMGMVKLMDDSERGDTANNYNFSIVVAIDEIVASVAKGELDIAAVPANLSSVLYNNTEGKVSVAAINTLGVLYVVQTLNTSDVEEIKTIQDLKGKTILSTGKGAVPEFALNYILSSNGIDPENDVNIEFKSEPTEIVTIMNVSSTASTIAVLQQPFVTTAQSKNENLKVVLDLTKEWDNVSNENKSSMITGVVIVRNEFLENNKEAFDKFLEEYKSSTDYINSNIEQGAVLVEKYDIIPANVAKVAIPKCNITFISGEEMKQKVKGYLQVLFNQNPKSVGGTLPDDTFYYKK